MTGKTGKMVEKTNRRCQPKFVLAFAAAMVLSATAAQGAFFDSAGKSARSMGMGEVFLASSGDVSSYWYNPAGLAKMEKSQVSLTYGLPVAAITDLNISQINFATPLGKGGLGLGLSYGGIDISNDMVLSGGYGVALTDRFALGGNVKIMRWSFEGQADPYNGGTDDDLSKVSFSLDLSASYGLGELFGLGNFSTGLYVKDAIMPNISESGDDGGKLPVETGIGLMMQRGDLMAEGDLAYVGEDLFLRLGVESGIAGTPLRARGGLIYGSDFEDETEKTDITLGLGYDFGSVNFNYAFNLPFEFSETDGKHFISFGVSF